MSVNTQTTKTHDSKFSIKNIKKSIRDNVVVASFSIAQPLHTLSKKDLKKYTNKDKKEIINEYINEFNKKYKDLIPNEIKNPFLMGDLKFLKLKDYDNLIYIISKSWEILEALTSGKTIDIIELDECFINHIKTIAAIIQFCLTAITYRKNKEKFKEGQLFTLSDLDVIPGFIMKVTDNGLIDVENSYFINHVDGSIIDAEEELFDFHFKMLIEGYSSPDINWRKLTKEQEKERNKIINAYLLDKLDGPKDSSKKMKFKKFNVLNKKGNLSKHTVELRPVVQYTHVKTVGDLLKLIYTFHYNQGLVYYNVDKTQQIVRNPEHGNGKNPIYSIGDKVYEIWYLVNENGSPKKINDNERERFDLSKYINTEEKEYISKHVTEARHYGADVEGTFNGYNATFGTGNNFDILLIK